MRIATFNVNNVNKRLGNLLAWLAGADCMFVVPEAQGRGLSRLLLTALEDAARELGYRRLRLDTGDRQPVALHLYVSAGYCEIPDYNGNPYASYWGDKDL